MTTSDTEHEPRFRISSTGHIVDEKTLAGFNLETICTVRLMNNTDKIAVISDTMTVTGPDWLTPSLDVSYQRPRAEPSGG